MTPLLTFNATRHVSLSLTSVATGIAAFATLAAITTSNTVAAQTTQAEPIALPAVVVTASRLPQTLSDTIPNTTLITRSDIERSGAVDLPALLIGYAGIELGSYGGVGQNTSLFLRGTDSNQVLVLLDGIPLNSQIGGAANLELIALENLERVEIVRGNVSAQYGSQAVGGVIQLFSKGTGTASGRTASVSLGTQGHIKAATSLDAVEGSTRYGIQASRTRYKGQSAIDTNQLFANPDRDGFGQTAISAYINHALTPDLKIGFIVNGSDMKIAYDNDDAPNPVADKQQLHKAATTMQLFSDWQITSAFKNTVKLSHLREKAIAENNQTYESASKDKQLQVSVQNELNTSNAGDFHFGAEYKRNKIIFDFPSYFSHVAEQRSSNAILAGWQGKKSVFGWNLNIRNEQAEQESINTYFAGVSVDITNGFSVKGSQSTAYIRPTVAERYGYGYGGYNANLLSGEALSKELAVQWAKGSQLVRLGVFKQDTVNQIVYDPSNQSFSNIKQARNKGVELSAELDAPWSKGKIKLSVSKQNPIDVVSQKSLSRRAKVSAALGLQGVAGAWAWDTSLKYQDNRSDTDYSTSSPVTLKSYTKLDASLSYAINPQGKIGLYLTNIGKANDQTAYGYSGTPRGAMVRLNYKM